MSTSPFSPCSLSHARENGGNDMSWQDVTETFLSISTRGPSVGILTDARTSRDSADCGISNGSTFEHLDRQPVWVTHLRSPTVPRNECSSCSCLECTLTSLPMHGIAHDSPLQETPIYTSANPKYTQESGACSISKLWAMQANGETERAVGIVG